MPIRVHRTEAPDVCELRAEDHRGETYVVELDSANGMTFEMVLCRHHLRTLRHVIVEV